MLSFNYCMSSFACCMFSFYYCRSSFDCCMLRFNYCMLPFNCCIELAYLPISHLDNSNLLTTQNSLLFYFSRLLNAPVFSHYLATLVYFLQNDETRHGMSNLKPQTLNLQTNHPVFPLPRPVALSCRRGFV